MSTSSNAGYLLELELFLTGETNELIVFKLQRKEVFEFDRMNVIAWTHHVIFRLTVFYAFLSAFELSYSIFV